MKWQTELESACKAADLAQDILKKNLGKLSQVEEKYQAGLVSEADRESEKAIRQCLLSRHPSHSFLGEETGLTPSQENKKSQARWIVDPLDGTNNYVHQLPIFCISIALEVEGEVVVAVIDAPLLQQRFTATRGGGAFLNGESISVSSRTDFSQFLLATGFNPQKHEELEDQVRVVAQLIGRSRGLRRLGAAAYDLCLVAQGTFDAYWEKNLQPWDCAAGFLLVEEAGGIVSDFKAEKFTLDAPGLVAASPHAHPEVLKTILNVYS